MSKLYYVYRHLCPDGSAYIGVTTNHTGTIDADYTGEIKVRLSNDSDDIFEIHPGDRIAQLVFSPVVQAIFEPVESIEPTVRGSRGFGSTGLK